MNFFARRRLRKLTRQMLHEASHARNMRCDLAKAPDLAALAEAEAAVNDAWTRGGDSDTIHQSLEVLADCSHKVLPPRPYSHVRENVEIFAVAIVVAMGFRTYFVQPFKIPTGSMEPTLFGIKVENGLDPDWTDKPPFRYAKYLVTGKRYVEVKAKTTGYVTFAEDRIRHEFYLVLSPDGSFNSGGVRHKCHRDMHVLVKAGQRVAKGTVMARGMMASGDHIFVNKVRYNFTPPRRGDIVVFRTEHIDHPSIQKTDHYIKRLVGLPGETVSVEPPYLVINGERITEPYCFDRLLHATDQGYIGYTFARADKPPRPRLLRPGDTIQLTDDQFLPFGDNTEWSLDGRYFGGVPVRDMIGPAFAVYWPFGQRWGRVR